MECLSPAINYAREGYVVSPNVAKVWKNHMNSMKRTYWRRVQTMV